MKIKRLVLENFRNFESLDMLLCDGVNLFCGNNAQGKTNLLEAIWLLCGQKSFRGSKEAEMIRHGQEKSMVEADFFSAERDHRNKMELIGPKKIVYHNGQKEATPTILGEYFHCVVFSPENLGLVKNGPEERRAFLDAAIGATKPAYFNLVRQYENVLYQRNSLLKKLAVRSSKEQEDVLDLWTQRLCMLGEKIYIARSRYTKRLEEIAPAMYNALSSGEELSLYYHQCEGIQEQNYAQSFFQALQQRRQEDIYNGFTGLGPHREELEILINHEKARTFASQGQSKSAALVLKLAEGQILAKAVGEEPVILLDDVMSELDRGRQNFILSKLGTNQIIITCCDTSFFRRKINSSIFLVKDDTVRQKIGRKGRKTCTPTQEPCA